MIFLIFPLYDTFLYESEDLNTRNELIYVPIYYLPKEEFQVVSIAAIQPYIENTEIQEMKAIISLSFVTGARISELLKVKKKDIFVDKEKNEFRIRIVSLKTYSRKKYKEAKEKGEKLIPPTRELVLDFNDPFIGNLIVPYIESLPTEDSSLFAHSKRYYQKNLFKLNAKIHNGNKTNYITFHYLRHSVITYIARELRATGAEIKDWTGHRGSSYEVYLIPSPMDKFKGRMGKR